MTDTTASAPKIPSDIGALLWAAERVVKADRAQSLDTFMIGALETACEAVRAALASQPVAMTLKERQKMLRPTFEAWAKREGLHLQRDSDLPDTYAHDKVDAAWAAWQEAASQPVAPAVPLTDEQFGASLPDEVARSFTPAELELFERGFRHAESVHKIASAPDTASASRDGREGSNASLRRDQQPAPTDE